MSEIARPHAGAGRSLRIVVAKSFESNRNFPGRSGPGEVWQASPSGVAASAIAGELGSPEAG
jgi:3-isopropylmalate/(R)-2-methylmalate dehydratase large subunit